MSRAAAGAPFSASCCALPSVLNRKCGSICSCSILRRDSASWRESSLCRRFASRCAVSAAYSRLRSVVISAISDRVEHAEDEAAMTTWRSCALSNIQAIGSRPGATSTSVPPGARRGSATRDGDDREAEDPLETSCGSRTTRRAPTTGATSTRTLNTSAASRNDMFHGSIEASHAASVVMPTSATSQQPAALAREPVVERANVAPLDLGERAERAIGERRRSGISARERQRTGRGRVILGTDARAAVGGRAADRRDRTRRRDGRRHRR